MPHRSKSKRSARKGRLSAGLVLRPLVIVLAFGCGGPPETDPMEDVGWVGTSVRHGDTITVRTEAGQVWTGVGRLVEEAAIGTETRGENDLLADVVAVAATGDRIYVADRILTTVRVYDWSGNHLLDIGRDGDGPGEFRNLTAMALDGARNHVVVKEASGFVHRLTLDGEYVVRYNTGFSYYVSGKSLMMRVTRDGTPVIRHIYVDYDPGPPRRFRERSSIFRVDSLGNLIDTLDLQRDSHDPFMLRASVDRESYRPQPVPFGPRAVWSLSMDGEFIRGVPNEYRFEIHGTDGVMTIIERAAEPVPVQPEEKEAWERVTYEILRDFNPRWTWEGPGIPDTKPFYSAIIPDHSGRLWVLREGDGRPVEGWTEPDGWRGWEESPPWAAERWFEVFEVGSGRFLGRVERPEACDLLPEPFIEGTTFICLTEDAVGRPVVKRYRLEF